MGEDQEGVESGPPSGDRYDHAGYDCETSGDETPVDWVERAVQEALRMHYVSQLQRSFAA